MIKKETPISMPEALEYMKGENTDEIRGFVKKFVKIDPVKAKQLRERLESLKIIKLNEGVIAKIVEMMPEDKESLNSLLQGTSLDENETNTILQTIKETQ